MQDLINYYQEHSLVHCFPPINTKLKCPYYVIHDSPRKQVKYPWSNPQVLPPTIASTPSDSAEQLHNPPVSKHVLYFSISKYCNYLQKVARYFTYSIHGYNLHNFIQDIHHKKKSRFSRIASVLRRKQSHKV